MAKNYAPKPELHNNIKNTLDITQCLFSYTRMGHISESESEISFIPL